MAHTPIGKIVKSTTHVDYVCQVYVFGEVPQPPIRPTTALARLSPPTGPDGAGSPRLIGLIYNTLLMNRVRQPWDRG